jgi:hypothetical protein
VHLLELAIRELPVQRRPVGAAVGVSAGNTTWRSSYYAAFQIRRSCSWHFDITELLWAAALLAMEGYWEGVVRHSVVGDLYQL